MYVVVRATNILGLTFIVRSDGIRVDLDPLVPGFVYDGYLIGFDLNYQMPTDKIWANWEGFGRGQVIEEPETTGRYSRLKLCAACD